MMRAKSKGVSLIELMVGITVGMLVIVGAIAFYVNTTKSQSDSNKLMHLNQNLRALMDIMSRDISRAGYADNTPDVTGSPVPFIANNPFFSTAAGSSTDLTIYDSGTCIVYSYNLDDDGDDLNLDGDYVDAGETTLAVDTNERLGFRLNGTNIQLRTGGATHNDDCTSGSWEAANDPSVEITALSFTSNTQKLSLTDLPFGSMSCTSGQECYSCESGDQCVYIRDVTITLTGRLRDDPNVIQTLNGRAHIFNNKIVSVEP